MGNNRIGTNEFLNQHCALAPDIESMLLARTLKILLQQYLPGAVIGLFGEVLRKWLART
jgi:hypothetical protein